MFHTIAVSPNMTTPIIAVFAFQLAGCAYHPPAGDQTCLGYLELNKPTRQNGGSKSHGAHYFRFTYGIFPPLECETEAPLDSTDLMEWSLSISAQRLYFSQSVEKEGASVAQSLGIGI